MCGSGACTPRVFSSSFDNDLTARLLFLSRSDTTACIFGLSRFCATFHWFLPVEEWKIQVCPFPRILYERLDAFELQILARHSRSLANGQTSDWFRDARRRCRYNPSKGHRVRHQ